MSQHPPSSLVLQVDRLEQAIGRMESDAESEKSTRARNNSEILRKIDKLQDDQKRTDRMLYAGIGVLGVVQVVAVPVIIAWLTK